MLICIMLLFTLPVRAQDQLPVPSSPGSWVNDYANLFSPDQERQLDEKLNRFEYRSSTQIFVVTIDENNGMPASMLAPMIGEAWGVGQKGKDNGMVVLVDMQDRDMFIATGYGNEEYITDAVAGQIVRNEIIPEFKNGTYYAGIDAATNVMISLLEGQFTQDQYRQQHAAGRGSAIAGLIFMIIMFSLIFGGGRRRSAGIGRSNLPLWLALGMLSGGRHSGSLGNFSSGSGGFSGGGGFGGFGGGGGGSFGGGGAGGSW